MNIKGMHGPGAVPLASGMRRLVTNAGGRGSCGAGQVGDSAERNQGISPRRKVLREEFIVFAAVASAYLLAWVASRVLLQ